MYLVLALLQAVSPSKEPSLFDKPEFTDSKFEASVDSGAHASAGAATRSAIPPLETLRLRRPVASDSANPQARAAFAAAVAHEDAGRAVEAAASFAQAAKLDPSAQHIREAGVHLLAHGAPARATQILDEGGRRFPADLDLRLASGLARFALAEYERARDLFGTALPDPRAAEGLALIADAAPALAASLVPMLGRWPLQQAIALVRNPEASKKDRAQAESLFKKAIVSQAVPDQAHFELAKLFLLEEKPSDAQRELEAVVRINGNHELARFRLAQLLQRTGHKESAARHLEVYRKLHAERLAKEESDRKSRMLLAEK